MARPKAVYELQCWRCQRVVEFEVDAAHRCPLCGANFTIVRSELPKPDPCPHGLQEHSVDRLALGNVWVSVSPEFEPHPGLVLVQGAIA